MLEKMKNTLISLAIASSCVVFTGCDNDTASAKMKTGHHALDSAEQCPRGILERSGWGVE